MLTPAAENGTGSAASNRLFRLGLLGVLVLGLLPRLYGLTERSLWFDEAFSWRMIRFPWGEMLERVGRDNHPPLYFILLKVWAGLFGDSALALRSLSVVFGLATIVGTYLFATETWGTAFAGGSATAKTCGQAIGLFSALLVAVSAFEIRYSWEARMYALAAALAVFSSWALVRALRTPIRGKAWLLYGSLALLLAYSHYYGLFTLACQAVFVIGFLWHQAGWHLWVVFRERQFVYAALTGGIVALAWLPWLPVFLHQRGQVKEAFWTHPVAFWEVAELSYQMFLRPEYLPPPPRQEQLWTFDICVLAIYLLGRKAGPAAWLPLCLGLGPLGFCLLTSVWDVPVLSLRYFLPAQAFLLAGVAALVWRIRFPLERMFGAAILLGFFIGVDFQFAQTMDLEHRPGSRAAAAFLARERRAGEPVITSMPFFFFSLLHYAPDRTSHYIYTDHTPMPHYYGTAAMESGDFINVAGLEAIRSRRVWVVELAGGFLGHRSVPVPKNWVEKGRRIFPDVFDLGYLILIEYDTGNR
jgi:mannosyltransferase